MLVPCAPSLAADAPVDAGRSAGRSLILLRDPRGCAIALVHERCIADVDAFLAGKGDADFRDVPKIGPHPASGLRAYVTVGDRDGFDFALSWINSRTSTAEMWAANPRGAALFDAGIEDVTIPAARGNMALELFAAAPVFDLAKHVAQIPAGTLPIDTAPIRPARASAQSKPSIPGATDVPPGTMQFAHALIKVIDTAMPQPRFFTLRYGSGPAADAALGVAGATVSELIDSPQWLAQADAQRFVDDYAARLAVVIPDHAAEITTVRSALRGDEKFVHDSALASDTSLMTTAMRSDPARREPILLGVLAAQLTYNAAVFRDSHMSATVLHVLATEPALDAAVPGWSSARAAPGVTEADWAAQYALGLRLVDLIRSANAT